MQEGFEKMNLVQIAYYCGYADLSHFIRDFKRYSGGTPVSLLKTGKLYSDLFTNSI